MAVIARAEPREGRLAAGPAAGAGPRSDSRCASRASDP